MITANIELTQAFNRGIAGLVYDAGINAKTVVSTETGNIIRTLVRLSPKASSAKIKDDIRRKFDWQRQELKDPDEGKQSRSGIKWIGVTGRYLTGIAPQNDMRGASVEELKRLLYKITKHGKIRTEFKHARKTQKVLLLQQILTKEATVNKLAVQKAANRGRLAAGWMVAIRDGAIKANWTVSDFIRKNINGGTRGWFMNGIQMSQNPNFTIANTAKGVSARKVTEMIQTAVGIRAKAMQANALLFMRGKKNIADYAR